MSNENWRKVQKMTYTKQIYATSYEHKRTYTKQIYFIRGLKGNKPTLSQLKHTGKVFKIKKKYVKLTNQEKLYHQSQGTLLVLPKNILFIIEKRYF